MEKERRKNMGVKESNEITVKIKSTLDEFYKIMEEKAYYSVHMIR